MKNYLLCLDAEANANANAGSSLLADERVSARLLLGASGAAEGPQRRRHETMCEQERGAGALHQSDSN